MFVSKYNCSPMSSNSSSVEDEAASPPISLAKLPRTAQSILVNRMRSVVWQGRTGRSTDQLREERRSGHGDLEQAGDINFTLPGHELSIFCLLP